MASLATAVATTVTQTVTKTVASTTATSTNRAAPQGGILEGGDPSHYNPKNPITIFIIQAGIIIIFCRLLHYPLSKLRQPRVIAEVIGGILLGPSVMGRIPQFTTTIFPTASMPGLTLAANLGLLLFLFLVGLEVDLRYLLSNWRVALSVGAAGMGLPFGLGVGLAYGIYHEFKEEEGILPINFGTFALFVGVAMAITAFPVLCRILTELKLLSTPVGVIVLSAGVGNDVVGWILLALCVALVNAGSGITALYVLLTAVGYSLFVAFAIRPGFLWLLRRTGSLQNGPSQGMVALTLLMALASAFFTDVIGIHAIFGAFIIGLVCPHEGGFAIKLTEKIEDLVSTILLPLYFTLSGLNTNLGLLDSGIAWAYVVAIIAVAFAGKIIGGTLASRANGLVWRESLTIGCLMSCKGLVELIVLNIGLQAKILSQRTFTMFVVMALVTTFATTPLVVALYPDWYQKKLELWKKGKIDWSGNPLLPADTSSDRDRDENAHRDAVRRLLVYLRLDGLPGLFTFITLLGDRGSSSNSATTHHTTNKADTETSDDYPEALMRRRNALEVHGLRLVELTERGSSVMQVSEIQEYANRDPVVKTFRTFGQFNDVAVAGALAVVPERSYADTLLNRASEISSDLVLIPWSETGSMSEAANPMLFNEDYKGQKSFAGPYASFVASILTSPVAIKSNVAIFVDRGFGGSIDTLAQQDQHQKDAAARRTLQRTDTGISIHNDRERATLPNLDHSHHIFVPFLGGADDYFALRFALQLARSENVTLTVIYFDITTSDGATNAAASTSQVSITSTFHGSRTATDKSNDDFFFNSARDTLPAELHSRVVFRTLSLSSSSSSPTTSTETSDAVLNAMKEDVGLNPNNSGDLIIVGRGKEIGGTTTPGGSGLELLRSFGILGSRMLSSVGMKASLVVVKAGYKDDSAPSDDEKYAGGSSTAGKAVTNVGVSEEKDAKHP